MKILQDLMICGLLISHLRAEEKKYEKLLDYEGVTVRQIEKDGIRIMHRDGVAKIPIEQLPDEVREELGMSMDGVEEHRSKVAIANAEAARKARVIALNKKILEASFMRIERATVFQVVDGGILAHVTTTSDGTFREVPTYKSVRVGNALSDYGTQKVQSGSKKVKNTSHYDDWLIFVSCDNKGLVDGSAFAGDVWAAGTFSYTTAIGGGKTIPKYTANPENIINR
jgi:hypothetical protein